MNVQYKGRQTVNSFGDKLVRPLEPAAIISFTEEEEDKVVAILEETGTTSTSLENRGSYGRKWPWMARKTTRTS